MVTTHFPASHGPVLPVVPTPSGLLVTRGVKGRRGHGVDGSMLPEQFFGPRASVGTACPEAALMRAVLEDALLCAQGRFVSTGRRGRRLAQEAEAWFFSDDTHWLFAFISICEVLGLEPGAVRAGVLRHRSSCKSIPAKKIRDAVTAPRTMHLSF